MANTIKIKNSGTPSASPGSLEHGELGLNYADGKIFFKNLSNTIVEFSTPPNLVIQNTAPANTSVLWADTSVTGVGVVPVGGTTGQVLSKGSNTSYDAVWANVVSSSDLALKANIASPTFTGTVTIPAGASISGFAPLANAELTGVPTAPTANAATNTTQIATTAFVRTEVANLVASAPAALDTLDELAAALGDDANFATTTATAIGLKAPLASPTFTGTVTIPAGASISGFAPLASPTFTGTVTLPVGAVGATQIAGNSTTALATTAFVTTADNLKANLASPTFTGTPAAPTASAGTNTTQIATMASRPWNTAWGVMSYTNRTSADSTITSEEVQLTGSSFTAVTGRLYKVTYFEPDVFATNATGYVGARTRLTNISGTILNECYEQLDVAGVTNRCINLVSVGTFTAGTQNVVATLQVFGANGYASRDSNAKAFLFVEDIGPA
jgi:hypothetical protein